MLGYAEAMLIAYNAKNKYRLPVKKLYGNQRDEELDDAETDDDTAAILKRGISDFFGYTPSAVSVSVSVPHRSS